MTSKSKLSGSNNPHQISNKPAWVYAVLLILVGSAAFISLAISLWTMTKVSSKLQMEIKLQAFNISQKIIDLQSTSELVTQLQNSVDDHNGLQNNVSRLLDSKLNNIVQLLTGQYSNLPADSYSHVLQLNPSSLSGH